MKRIIVDYGIAAVVALSLALLVQAFVLKPYRIPSPSMERTLMVGDRVLVNRLVFHFRSVRRGDVVVFKWPRDRSITFVKRVIGLPGDTVSLAAGRVYINGAAQNEPYLPTQGGQPVPTVPGPLVEGSTMSSAWALRSPYKVPTGQYFVMGDNRTRSDDSRDWGTVPAGNVIGGAFFIYWPLGRLRIL
jgi:signal peptidase I